MLIFPLSQHSNATTGTPRSYSTTGSTLTSATSTGTGGETANDDDQAAQQAFNTSFPPPDPLTLGFGAQFVDQIHQNAPLFPQQRDSDRRARMTEFHNAFASLGVYLTRDILEQVENARYGVMAPDTVLAQLAARYSHEDPRTRWLEAQDVWNTVTSRIRARLPEVDPPLGWDELEALPFQE